MSVSLSFESMKPDTDFSLDMKHLDGIFFQHKAVSYTLKMLCTIATFISYLSEVFLDNFDTSACCFTFHIHVLVMASFLNLMNQPLLASYFSSAASSLLSAFTEGKAS